MQRLSRAAVADLVLALLLKLTLVGLQTGTSGNFGCNLAELYTP